jgi:hypothetical protein
MHIILVLALISVVLQFLIFVITKRKHKDVCNEYFAGFFFKNEKTHIKKTMAFYYSPLNWARVNWAIKVLLSVNFTIFVYILYVFFLA